MWSFSLRSCGDAVTVQALGSSLQAWRSVAFALGFESAYGRLSTSITRVLAVPAGKLVSRSWHDYKIPTAMDVPPEIASLPIETDSNSANTVGAKGLGEPVTIPTAPAIANAVYDATGVRMTDAPITPGGLLERLRAPGEEVSS